jgi:biopolymer transport protein ExbD
MYQGILFFIFLFPGLIYASDQAAVSVRSIVVVAEPVGKHVQYRVQGQVVPSEKLLDSLGNRLLASGREVPVVILVRDDAPIATIWNVLGIVQKVGFSNIRIFSFGTDRRMMAEVTLDHPAVPFSEVP